MEITVMYGGINFDLMVTNICLLAIRMEITNVWWKPDILFPFAQTV
jgi:hypothetical protein